MSERESEWMSRRTFKPKVISVIAGLRTASQQKKIADFTLSQVSHAQTHGTADGVACSLHAAAPSHLVVRSAFRKDILIEQLHRKREKTVVESSRVACPASTCLIRRMA
jgi:hypothetical protein